MGICKLDLNLDGIIVVALLPHKSQQILELGIFCDPLCHYSFIPNLYSRINRPEEEQWERYPPPHKTAANLRNTPLALGPRTERSRDPVQYKNVRMCHGHYSFGGVRSANDEEHSRGLSAGFSFGWFSFVSLIPSLPPCILCAERYASHTRIIMYYFYMIKEEHDQCHSTRSIHPLPWKGRDRRGGGTAKQ